MRIRVVGGMVLCALWGTACDGCGEEPGSDASGHDAALADHRSVDAGRVDGAVGDATGRDTIGHDSATSDAVAVDHTTVDGAVADGAVADGAIADGAIVDGAIEDAGTPVTIQLSIKLDELGTDQVADVRVQFVRVDWEVFNGPVVCEDGGPGDAAGVDGGGLRSWRTEPIGQAALLTSVTRSIQHFTLQVPEAPPAEQLGCPPNDLCCVTSTARVGMYQALAFLDGSGGTAGVFDDHDDIVGQGDRIPYASGTGAGVALLVYAAGATPPLGMSAGWNYLIVGFYDGAPEPEPGTLASDEFPLSITTTPHPTLTVAGQFTVPTGGVATTDADRRTALLANRRLAGVDELVSLATTGTTYSLDLPTSLAGANLSDYVIDYGPISVATGVIVTYLDTDHSGDYTSFGEQEGATSQSCPTRDIWYFSEPLGWPWVMITGAHLSRGYNIVGRQWNADTLQIEPLVNIAETDAIDIDIPMDSDADYTNNQEPTADTGCACGLIPAPYTSGCR